MPYPCAPGETAAMERCIEKVMAQGHDKDSAIGICCASIGGKEYNPDQPRDESGRFGEGGGSSGGDSSEILTSSGGSSATRSEVNRLDRAAKKWQTENNYTTPPNASDVIKAGMKYENFSRPDAVRIYSVLRENKPGDKESKMSQNSITRAKQKASLRRQLKESQRKAEAERQALDDALTEDEPEMEITVKHGGMEMPTMAVEPEPPYGGALTLADAMADMDSDRVIDAMEFAFNIFDGVKTNIRNDESVMDKGAAIAKAARELQALLANPAPLMKEAQTEKAEWDTAYINDLPDSAFLHISPGGEKDESGKTVPRSLRHFPYRKSTGAIDLPHLRNAIARIPQSNAPGLNKDALQERARKLLAGEQEGEKEKDVAQARIHLAQAIELHQAHIDGEEPTSEASQEELMGHIKAALAELPEEKQHGGAHAGHGGAHAEPTQAQGNGGDGGGGGGNGDGGGSSGGGGGKRGAGTAAREEFDRVQRRLQEGHLKPGEKTLLEKRSERLAQEILAGKEFETETDESIRAKSFVESISDAVSGVLTRFREGRRHNTKDQTNLQTIHSSAVDLGAECTGMTGKESSLEIFKDADGKLRWITYSSSAYQDKDKEIVSQKALAGAADDMRRTKAYGPLRWWHVPGADFGPCDFSALHERILVETGTFSDEEIGQSLKEHADELEVSIGFTHPKDQPDADGVFDKVNIFERSLLPKGKASNHLTAFNVKEVQVDKDKQAELEAKIGKDKAQAILDGAAAKRKEADEKDARYKAKAMSDMTEDDVAAMMTKAMAPYVKELKELKDALAVGKGEKDMKLTEAEVREKAHVERLAAIETGLTAALAGVAELKGEQPRAALHRPSESGKIVGEANAQGQIVKVEERFKNVFPQADPLAKFMDALMPGSVAPGQQ